MQRIKWLLMLAVISMLAIPGYSQESAPGKIYTFTVKTNDGQDKKLSDEKGKVLLIVNTASKCGYAFQLGSLEKLYQQYKDRGLEILAFPSNDFKQEFGTDEEIKNFCTLNYKTTFPILGKISVKGEAIHPLYRYLTEETKFKGPITWNFNKFLVDVQGKVVLRYPPNIDPMSEHMTKKIEELLP